MTAPCTCCACTAGAMRGTARRYLRTLGKENHPDAKRDPVSALGQVAVDLQTALTLQLAGASVHRADPPDTPQEV